MAIPSGAPPGRTSVSAVEACVKASEPIHESCGSSAFHGRAVVRTSRRAATASATAHAAETVASCLRDAPVARDPRDDLDEDDGDERQTEREAENGPAATPHVGSLGSGPAHLRC